MKTKNSPSSMAILKLFLIVPGILLILIAVSSCAAKKKVDTVYTEIVLPPPPPPPPPTPPNQDPVSKDNMNSTKAAASDESEQEPFVVVEEMPMFPGGDSTLLAYISHNIKYPETAEKNKIEGRVILRFCITAKGNVNRVSILRGVDPGIDAEAVRVISSLPSFKPGKQGGKEVPVWYMVPVVFALK